MAKSYRKIDRDIPKPLNRAYIATGVAPDDPCLMNSPSFLEEWELGMKKDRSRSKSRRTEGDEDYEPSMNY